MIFSFVDIVDHYCLTFPFITYKAINVYYLVTLHLSNIQKQ
jgi:hypothetical protein